MSSQIEFSIDLLLSTREMEYSLTYDLSTKKPEKYEQNRQSISRYQEFLGYQHFVDMDQVNIETNQSPFCRMCTIFLSDLPEPELENYILEAVELLVKHLCSS